MAQKEEYERIDYVINEPGILTGVMNQKEQGCCLAVALADIVSMVMRISKRDPYALVSPQPMIDADATSAAKLLTFATVYGIESQSTYPFTRVKKNWDESVYFIREFKKYKLHGLLYFDNPDDIRKQIIKNFGAKGKRYPILGALDFKGFFDPEKARECIVKKKPFNPRTIPKQRKGAKRRANDEEDEEHAVVITGCNTVASGKRGQFCHVKNSHDVTWGKDGSSLVQLDAFKLIMVPVYNPTMVYVALPLKTINIDCEIGNKSVLISNTLEKLKLANADGVLVNVLWGIVERSNPKEYNWGGYKELFEVLKENKLMIQVVICLHELTDGDFTVPLPSWVLSIGEKDTDIFFKDEQQESNRECLSWGIDNKRVLGDRSALEVYSDLIKSFQSTFDMLLKERAISIVEIGLGPHGELRYPSCCSRRGWKYPGVGGFQCYDKYMVNSLKEKAAEDQYEFFENVLKIGNSYNFEPDSCDFFRKKDKFDSLKSRYFLNWYAQELIKHGDRVLSKARSTFGDEVVINVKLSGIHWWFTDRGESHAAELTAGFFNSCQHNGYELFLKMLKANKVGLNVTVRSYDSYPTQSSENSENWMKAVRIFL